MHVIHRTLIVHGPVVGLLGLLVLGCPAGGHEPSSGSDASATPGLTAPPDDTSGSTLSPTSMDSTSDVTSGDPPTTGAPTTGPGTATLDTTTDAGTTGTTGTTSIEGTTEEPAVCGDGVVAGSEACDDGNAINDDDCSNACDAPRLVFVTNAVFKGDMGPPLADKKGLDLADAQCQLLAEMAGKTGSFRAWLSDADGSPATRFDTGFQGAYKLVDGSVVAGGGWADLTDGTLAHPIDLDQTGAHRPADAVWTNTQPNGTVLLAGESCSGWTSASGATMSQAGFSSSTDGKWSSNEPNYCSVSDRLYCFEQ